MPAIRDTSFAFETITTDAGITISLPTNSANDLLIAFIMGDTGAPTWTLPSGWTQLFVQNNTVSTLCAWKISNGSEPTSVTFGSTVNETYNGTILSVRDVNTTNPFGNPSVFNRTTQAAAAKFNMQQITTNVNNALCLAFSANSVAGVPSFIENKAMSLIAADGAAESMGIGWFFMPTAGLTPSNISCSNVATGAGVKAVVQIAPPSGGATVIPTYIASDSCTYIDPINGTTAYNANTALATTADTNFGTVLGGITAEDGTVSAQADTGLNSFHSTGALASLASNNIGGAELVLAVANRPDVTGKNVLCHITASTPLQLQRLTNVASGKGVWFGMRSAAANYKIWQVLGTDSPGADKRPIPVIINESAINTKATGGTLVPSAIQAFGWWVGGKIVGTSTWYLASIWLMDVTVVGGGISAEPMNLEGIVKAIADSHERKSAILQGANQMLLLQDLQIGDGGTHPVFLDLNGTAIELPSQYSSSTRQVSYNSVDNKIGLLYYPGASDTIKHRNSVVSSPSRYKWGLHASASASASYDFSGLSVIGAGTITLNKAITVSGLTINNYVSINSSSLILNNSKILNVPTTNGSLTVDASSQFNSCELDVSAITAGNYLTSTTTPSIFQNCKFTGGGGHAIRITTPGTYTFNGNTFTGFGTGNNAAIFNDSGGLVTLNITGGGSTPTIRNGAGASTVVNSNILITLTGLKTNSEVRVYLDSSGQNGTEIDGVESSGTSFSFSVAASSVINIMINHINYLPADIWGLNSGTSNSTIPISQVTDRNYLNP